MNWRPIPQSKIDDAFPVRVMVRVPERGFERALDAMYRWLDREIGRGDYAHDGSGRRLPDASAFYFRTTEQTQKHVTHNEALRLLDGLVQLAVLERDLTAPPGSPADGDRYIVASGATGDRGGWDGSVAYWVDGAWMRLVPGPGWRAWRGFAAGVRRVGLDRAAPAGTAEPVAARHRRHGGCKQSVRRNAQRRTLDREDRRRGRNRRSLLHHEQGDVGRRSRAHPADGVRDQGTAWLFGSDKFRLAVSADGSSFFDGLIVDNTNGIVDQPRLPRFKAYTNVDNYVPLTTWTKIAINNTEYQGAFDTANNRFVAPVAGTYLFGASLLYKVNASTTARMNGRLVMNGSTEIKGGKGEVSATHVSLAATLTLQTLVPLAPGDTVEPQRYFRVADGYFAGDHTTFWGCKVG